MSQFPPVQPGPPYQVSREAPGATTGLVLGIISVVANFPIVGLLLAIIGFQRAREAKALCDANPGMYTNGGIATAGYVLCIVGICLGALSSLCGCGYFAVVIIAMMSAAAGSGGP